MNSKQLTDKTLFISRQLDTSSIFQQLKAKDWTIIDRSLLKIEHLEIEIIPLSDWVFFYSPNAVKAFTQNANRLKFPLDSLKIAVYGPGTAEVAQSLGMSVEFTGTGEHEGTLQQFNKIASDSKVLFPRASNSKNAMLADGFHTFHPIDLVIYENSMKPDSIPDCSIYIFTSSMNAKSFFVKNRIPSGAEVIAIGPPTAKTLAEYNIGEIRVPSEPTELELFNLLNTSY